MADLAPSLSTFRLLGILPSTVSADLTAIYTRALANLELTLLDYQGIRDLICLSRCHQLPAHVLLLGQFHAINQGSLCQPLAKEPLTRALALLVDDPPPLAEAIHRFANSHASDLLIGKSPTASTPFILTRSHKGPLLYAQKDLANEQLLRDRLQALIAPKQALTRPPDADIAAAVHDVTQTHIPQPAGNSIHLTPTQRLALWTSLLQPFTIISGGPGTGKTSVVLSILRCHTRLGITPDQIAIAAPTGRAAQRLTETITGGLRAIPAPLPPADAALTHLQGTTIHALLSYRPYDHRFAYNEYRKLPCKLIVIDEVSMVDVATMAALLDALATGTRVIFLGDKDQLPSVDSGALLSDLIPRDTRQRFTPTFYTHIKQLDHALPPVHETSIDAPLINRIVILTESHRSEQRILTAAAAVNRGQRHLLSDLPTLSSAADLPAVADAGGCHIFQLTPKDRTTWEKLLDAWAEYHICRPPTPEGTPYTTLVRRAMSIDLHRTAITADDADFPLLSELFSTLDRARILTFIREGRLGCIGVNRYLTARLRPRLAPHSRGDRFAGCPILIRANKPSLHLYNGDVAIIIHDDHGTWRAIIKRLDSFLLLPLDHLPAHEQAFAMTIHKSQGSEYDHALILLPPGPQHRLLTREVLYTGLTRAKSLAIIAGTTPALEHAISTPITRISGLDIWPPPPQETGDSTWGSLPLFG